MNERPDDLERALDSLTGQVGVHLDILLIGNGCQPETRHADIRTIALHDNVGIPEGRNIGARVVSGECLLFLDSDAWLPDSRCLRSLAEELLGEPRLAYVQPRVADWVTMRTLRRWVPRFRGTGPTRPGPATVMAEGVVLIRADAFWGVGGWAGHFFLGHEGVDLAWRLWDRGQSGAYVPDIVVHHPATEPSRHPNYHRLDARNRVWVARRNLPWPLVPVYLAGWAVLTALRLRNTEHLRAWKSGFLDGWRLSHGERRPLRARTILRLTAAGRPPVL